MYSPPQPQNLLLHPTHLKQSESHCLLLCIALMDIYHTTAVCICFVYIFWYNVDHNESLWMKSLQQNTVKWPLCVLAKFFTYLPSMTFWSQKKKKMTFCWLFCCQPLIKNWCLQKQGNVKGTKHSRYLELSVLLKSYHNVLLYKNISVKRLCHLKDLSIRCNAELDCSKLIAVTRVTSIT